jgi:hypothetical protein
MRTGNMVGAIARPVVSATVRARQSKNDGRRVTKQQWLAYVAVAAATTWLTKRLDDLIEHHLGGGAAA